MTALTVANGLVFVASKDTHTLYALEEGSGEVRWQFVTGGRIDSPPTLYNGLVLFGSADGWIYSLRDEDGTLAWRFRAAPLDRRLLSFEQVESVWPVHGSLLIEDETLYAVAGRSCFLDGGLRLYRMDPVTGEVLSETVLDEHDEKGRHVQDYVSWLNMPVALPDVLSSDGKHIYMRSQAFQLDGKRLPLEKAARTEDPDRGAVLPTQQPEYAHIFCPTGFLDDSWWHRTYWLYGSTFVSGWSGYYLAGKSAPAGRILVADQNHVYGFGRRPEYFRWTTPLEYQLFSSKKLPALVVTKDSRGRENQRIEYEWNEPIPLLVRAMLISGETLFLAGPPDLVDEEEAAGRISDPKVQERLIAQNEALEGSQGGVLWVVSAADGTKIAEYKIAAPPVFDGMALANHQLYVSTIDGHVICLQEN
jgi:outer membrane protein assembly factor BamB